MLYASKDIYIRFTEQVLLLDLILLDVRDCTARCNTGLVRVNLPACDAWDLSR